MHPLRLSYTALTYAVDGLTPLLARLPGKTGAFFRGRRAFWKKWQSMNIPQGAVWIHAASAGEYEQALPVLQALRKQMPQVPVVVSFFSPSVYESRKNKVPADAVFYLPVDTPRNARRLVERLRPRAVLMVKYEFWPNLLDALGRNRIPLFLVSGIFRPGQAVLRYGFLRRSLRHFTRFMVQDQASAALLEKYGFRNVSITGDTRFDRVLEVAAQPADFPVVRHFKGDAKLLVAGSTWPADEDLLLDYWQHHKPEGWKLFIVPHEPGPVHIGRLMNKCGNKAARYSGYKEEDGAKNILIGDVKGLLKYVYRTGDAAYVGGGFGRGIHNILEAAVYGLPVVFGPKYGKFREARDLLDLGGAFSVQNADGWKRIFEKLQDDDFRRQSGAKGRKYVREQAGATERIIKICDKFIR